MTDDLRFPLEELAKLADVSERQIRELVRLRLLPAPSSGGRGATYGAEHLDRLRAWKALKRKAPASTTNDQLGLLLDKLGDSGLLRTIADGKIPFDLVDDQKTDVAIAGSTERRPGRCGHENRRLRLRLRHRVSASMRKRSRTCRPCGARVRSACCFRRSPAHRGSRLTSDQPISRAQCCRSSVCARGSSTTSR